MSNRPGLFLDSGEFISADELNRWNGTSRPAALDEALPNTPNEFVPLPRWRTAWIAFGLVTMCAIGGYIVLPALKGVL